MFSGIILAGFGGLIGLFLALTLGTDECKKGAGIAILVRAIVILIIAVIAVILTGRR